LEAADHGFALYVSLSSQIALEKRLTTLADNVANANTIGFRATEVKFEALSISDKPGRRRLRGPPATNTSRPATAA
jgi:flagellar basal body rod protein FlgG